MSFVHYVRAELDKFSAKDEPEAEDAPENSNTCEVQTEKIIFHETQAKCGDVFVGCQGNFTLVCSVCRDEFETFDSFGLHIKERHLGQKSYPEVPMEHIFTETLPIWDDTNKSCSSSREKAIKNLNKPGNPTRTQLEPLAKVSQPTINNSLQPNQYEERTRANRKNEIWQEDEEWDDKSSSNEFTPEKDVESNTQTGQPRKEYFCVPCGRTYITRRYFVAHNKKKHNKIISAKDPGDEASDKPTAELVKMVCKYCDECFDDQNDFKNHMSIHTGRYRFVCPICPKTFIARYNRDVHINTHTGERPFKCTHCPKAFSDGRNLSTHIRMHLGIMKYSCDYCNKRFVQSTEKKLHERTHTGERPYQCEECGMRFIAHVQLMEHHKRHKNIRNYKCEVCSKAYYNSNLLKNHMRAHTGERPFKCRICAQTFAHRKSLRTHEKRH